MRRELKILKKLSEEITKKDADEIIAKKDNKRKKIHNETG